MTADPENAIAVVIPAWRGEHLAAAVASLAAQTDQRFHLYIGDDASPDPIHAIVQANAGSMAFSYHRFDRNLGGTDLVGHWHRCIALTRSEPWLWLFSDDDVAEPGCIAAIHAHLAARNTTEHLLRFNLEVIGSDGSLLFRPQPHPARETAAELAREFLTNTSRHWRAADHVFSRFVYEREGGFFPCPKALYSDWATWIRFSHPHGVVTLPGARLLWREHAQGTSSGLRAKHRAPIFEGLLTFSAGLIEFAARHPELGASAMHTLTRDHFFKAMHLANPPLTLVEIAALSSKAACVWGGTQMAYALRLGSDSFRSRLRNWPILQSIARLRAQRGQQTKH